MNKSTDMGTYRSFDAGDVDFFLTDTLAATVLPEGGGMFIYGDIVVVVVMSIEGKVEGCGWFCDWLGPPVLNSIGVDGFDCEPSLVYFFVSSYCFFISINCCAKSLYGSLYIVGLCSD
jgi:hypothetical protein